MRGGVEGTAAATLRDWLLLKLPAKVAEVNAARFAFLRAAFGGPYTVPAGKTLGITTTTGNNFTSVSLTSGTRTATQLAADINAAMGATVGTEDSEGRLLLTSPIAPVVDVPSLLRIRGQLNSDANTIFGWNLGGALNVTTALVTPAADNVWDGLPSLSDLVNTGGRGPVVVVIEDRLSAPTAPGPRANMYLVTLPITVARAEPAQQVHKNREHIQAAVQCVREVLSTEAGRQLGRAAIGDVELVMMGKAKVAGQPMNLVENKVPVGPLYDFATFELQIRMYERPAA